MDGIKYRVVDDERFQDELLSKLGVNHSVYGISVSETGSQKYIVDIFPRGEFPQSYAVSEKLIHSLENNGVIELKTAR